MKTVSRGHATVLSLGTDDLTNPPCVEAAFKEILSLLPRKNIVVDMQGVTRLTSMGVSAISAGAELARRREARLALAGVRPEVLSLIRRTLGVRGPGERAEDARLVDVADDVESALRTLEGEDEQTD